MGSLVNIFNSEDRALGLCGKGLIRKRSTFVLASKILINQSVGWDADKMFVKYSLFK